MTTNTRSIVLYYHRAANPECDPYQLAVSPARLSEQLAVLREHVEVVPLHELVAGRSDRHLVPRAAVTFDDGYADNLLEAAPRLEAAGVPATVFVTTSVLTATGELWWDRLGHLFTDHEFAERHLTVALAGRPLTIDVGDRSGRKRALAAIRQRLYQRRPTEIDDALDHLASALGVEAQPTCPEHALLDEGQLRELARAPGIDIGSHTVCHPRLSVLPGVDQARELEQSRADLEAVVGETITSFAYPFGERTSYSRETVALLKRSGYATAYTTDHRPVGRLTSRYRVPRYRVEDWTGDEFELALRGWIGASEPAAST